MISEALPPVREGKGMETSYGAVPVTLLAHEERRPPEDGMALCLSGGGYRAMLFHVGAVWRLGDLGLLPQLRRVSSVSGGSITAGLLGIHWKSLNFSSSGVPLNLREHFVEPLRRLASRTIDVPAVLIGFWRGTVADHIAQQYRRHLFGDATLQDFPADKEGPRIVLNAMNVQSGVLWRFSRPYMADYRVGQVDSPRVDVAVAVAASSAFPPFLSPLRLELDPRQVKAVLGTDLHRPPFTTRAILTDGGVYDNLGLETAWKRYRTILVSDAGGAIVSEGSPRRDWPRHTYRILTLIDHQVRSRRMQQLINSYRLPPNDLDHRQGAYWGIRTDISAYGLRDALPAALSRTIALAETPTRLQAMPAELQERLINWGYAICDAAVRRFAFTQLPPPTGWPYPESTP
jgi:NTE family protein